MPPELLPRVQKVQRILYITYDNGVVVFELASYVGVLEQVVQVLLVGAKFSEQPGFLGRLHSWYRGIPLRRLGGVVDFQFVRFDRGCGCWRGSIKTGIEL